MELQLVSNNDLDSSFFFQLVIMMETKIASILFIMKRNMKLILTN